ncbi:hypothetical protein [Cytobacillus oceanisediminis]|uniref:hypothetical protein n=1 Tax=Cytobacillus oceanisediminis TaxID=665099 RepID=UPI00203EB136|nr:hypothetical protein [Cytobacillus oceanisediminis]MCM3405940.1 hypothetical protein [Cytobacillus oceanisediminis]
MVDDHAIDSLRTWFDIAYDDLKKEWKSSNYENLRDCPSFKLAYTYREALNILIEGPKHVDETQLKRMIDEELETENHWKNK